MSFGYHRAEIIGALVSVNLIWGLTIWLLYEATLRIVTRTEVDGLIMLITAIIGFVFNIVMGLVLAYQGIDHNLHHHHHGDEEEGHGHVHVNPTARRSFTMGSKEEMRVNLPRKIKHEETCINLPRKQKNSINMKITIMTTIMHMTTTIITIIQMTAQLDHEICNLFTLAAIP